MSIDWEAMARGVTAKVERDHPDSEVRQLAKDVGESMDASKAAGVSGPISGVQWLDCPCCSVDCVPSQRYCFTHELSARICGAMVLNTGDGCRFGPVWFEDQQVMCPECGCEVGISLQDGSAPDYDLEAYSFLLDDMRPCPPRVRAV